MNGVQTDFVRHMRDLYDSRDDAAELGFASWEPTAKQLNFLLDIVSRHGA